MHAIVVNVTVTDPEAAQQGLRDQVVPRISKAPGFVAGYWTRKGDTGLSMTIWDSEEDANNAGEQIRAMAPEFITIENVEVREVVAQA